MNNIPPPYTADEWRQEQQRAFDETLKSLKGQSTLSNQPLTLIADDTLLCIDGYPVGRFGDLPQWARAYVQFLLDQIKERGVK